MISHGSLFPIRRGEGRQAALLTAAMFLTFAGLGVGAPGVESLFLTRLGARYLPYVYLALGAVTVGLTVLISTVFARLPRKSLYQGIPIALAAWLVAARLLVGMGASWSYAPIFLSLYVAWTLQNLFTWGAASLVFDTRQAKRLFPLFAAGGILGRALGGLSAGLWVRLVGAENLLLLWVGALLAAFLCVRLVLAGVALPAGSAAALRRPPGRGPSGRSRSRGLGGRRPGARGFGAGLAYVAGSRLLRRLAAAAMLLSGVYFLVVYPFSREVALAFPEAERLAAFLGLFQGLTTAVAFLASMLLANRFFARFGLMAGIGVFALIYLAGFSGLAVAGIFPVLAAFRFLELTWLYGFSNTAFQAVFNILPAERREQSRLSVDGVFRQVGISAAGGLLILAEGRLALGQLALIGAALAAAAVLAVLLARASYTGALARALREGRPEVFTAEAQPFGAVHRDPAAVATVLSALQSDQPRTRKIAAEILGDPDTARAAPQATAALVRVLRDPYPEVRVAALGSLGAAGASDALLEVSSLLQDPAPEVRRQAAAQLGRLASYPEGLRAALSPLLADEEPAVRAAAASVLLPLGDDPPAFALLEAMARSEQGEQRVLAFQALEQGSARGGEGGRWGGGPGSAGGRWGDEGGQVGEPAGPAQPPEGAERAYDLARAGLQDPLAAVRGAALRALARIDAPRSLDALAAALGDEDPSVAAEAGERLGQAAAGTGSGRPPETGQAAGAAQARQLLLQALEDPAREAGALQGLERLPARGEATAIRAYALRKLEESRRYARLEAALGGFDGRAGTLLASALEGGRRAQAQLALQAVGLLRGPDTVRLALRNLGSAEPQLRANALEMIDSLGEREITGEVTRAFESEAALPRGGQGREAEPEAAPPSLPPAPLAELTELLHDRDAWVRACAAYAAAAIPAAGRDGLGAEMERLAADPDPLVRDTALRGADNGEDRPMEEVQRLSMMERILWLQGVPLFAELPPPELKQVAAVCFETRFADGELIGAQGEPGEEMFVIVSGEVRIVAGETAGPGRELARRRQGEHVGEMSVLSGAPRVAAMVAAGEVHLLGIARREFEQILRQRPETSLAVMRVLCARLKEAQDRESLAVQASGC